MSKIATWPSVNTKYRSDISITSNRVSVSPTNTSSKMLADNVFRKSVIITNATDQDLYIGIGTIAIEANDLIIEAKKNLIVNTTEEIHAISPAGAAGYVIVREML